MKYVIAAVSLFLVSFTQADPNVIAERVQAVYDNEQGLSADFVQYFRSGTTGKVLEESGKLVVKKPGKMRWDYLRPDKKLYVSDGETVYWYVEKDRQVTKMSLSEADQEQAQILFLMGKGNLARDFTITFTDEFRPYNEDSFLLRLVPKKEENFDYLLLEVNPRDYFVERLITVDPLGNTTEYHFKNIFRSTVSDGIFSFVVPRGVEVIDMMEDPLDSK